MPFASMIKKAVEASGVKEFNQDLGFNELETLRVNQEFIVSELSSIKVQQVLIVDLGVEMDGLDAEAQKKASLSVPGNVTYDMLDLVQEESIKA